MSDSVLSIKLSASENYCGRDKVIRVPCGAAGWKSIDPPKTSQTLKANGMPKPVPKRLVVGPGLMACGFGVNGMPQPWSVMLIAKVCLLSCASSWMVDALGEASMAFNNKLYSTCSNKCSSVRIADNELSILRLSWMFFSISFCVMPLAFQKRSDKKR